MRRRIMDNLIKWKGKDSDRMPLILNGITIYMRNVAK